MSKRQKIALVTGGMGSLGTDISRRFYKEGFTVAVTCRPGSQRKYEWLVQQAKQGFHFNCIECDVTNWESTEQALADLKEKLGTVDILVNNAGITKDTTFQKMSYSEWNEVINTNLSSLFITTKQVLEGMLIKGWGRIINISSVNGQRGQFGQTNYSAAKAGVHGFSMALARELGSKGITVNTVSPGYLNSSMTAPIPDQVMTAIINSIPVKRLGETMEIASLITWLASEESAYANGANFSLNGGLQMQ